MHIKLIINHLHKWVENPFALLVKPSFEDFCLSNIVHLGLNSAILLLKMELPLGFVNLVHEFVSFLHKAIKKYVDISLPVLLFEYEGIQLFWSIERELQREFNKVLCLWLKIFVRCFLHVIIGNYSSQIIHTLPIIDLWIQLIPHKQYTLQNLLDPEIMKELLVLKGSFYINLYLGPSLRIGKETVPGILLVY